MTMQKKFPTPDSHGAAATCFSALESFDDGVGSPDALLKVASSCTDEEAGFSSVLPITTSSDAVAGFSLFLSSSTAFNPGAAAPEFVEDSIA